MKYPFSIQAVSLFALILTPTGCGSDRGTVPTGSPGPASSEGPSCETAASSLCSVCESHSASMGFTTAQCVEGTTNQCQAEGWDAEMRTCVAAFSDANRCDQPICAEPAMTADGGTPRAGDGDAGGAVSNPGATCGYSSACVPAAIDSFCSSQPGTRQYQCCKPAEPPSSAGCTASDFGTNESVATYCCTGSP